MDFSMACTAKSDEIFFHIASQLASRLHVMDLQILSNFRIVGIASHRARALAGKAPDRNPGPSEAWVVFGRLIS